MNSTTEFHHQFEQCTAHPQNSTTRTENIRHREPALIQAWCTTDQCNHPLGWAYTYHQDGQTHIRRGSGKFNDQQVMNHQDRLNYDANTTIFALLGLLFGSAPFLAVSIGAITVGFSNPVAVLHMNIFSAALLCTAALTVALAVAIRCKKRPTPITLLGEPIGTTDALTP